MCFSKKDINNTYDELARPIDNTHLDETLWNDKYDYLTPETIINLYPESYNLVTVQLNIWSILAHQFELKKLLNTLDKKNSKVDIMMLCETFLSDNTVNLVKIAGYELVSNQRKHSKGGVTILVKEGTTYKCHKDLDIFIEKQVESVFIEILAKNGKHIIVGSMYHPPNTDNDVCTEAIREICFKLSKEKENKELILGMDHNYDLLKSADHRQTQILLDTLLDIYTYIQ